MWMSEFRLLPGDPRWRRTNVIGGGVPLIAFPRTTVAIRHEGRREVVADPLSAVLYAPGEPYRRRAITEVGDDCTALALSPAVAAEAASPYDPAAADRHTYRFPFVASALEATDYAAIQKLRTALSSKRVVAHDPAVREELYWIVSRVIGAGYMGIGAKRERRHATELAHGDAVEAVRERIGAELHVTHPLDALASAVHASPFHLARTFRERTGRSIHAYRTELRLRASLAPIADGVPLTDVAQQLGFASHAHLTDRFRRAHGVGPREWRRTLETRPNLSKIVEAVD